MKRTIGLILAVILLITMIGTALAACQHNWFTVSTLRKAMKYEYYRTCNGDCYNGITKPHFHKVITATVTETISLCTKCGEVKKIYSNPVPVKEICTW